MGSRIYACYTLLKLIMCLNDCPEIKTLSVYLDRMQKIEKLSHVRKSLEHWKTKSSVTCSQLWQSASSPFIYNKCKMLGHLSEILNFIWNGTFSHTSNFCSPRELHGFNFKSVSTQTFPDTYSNQQYAIFICKKHQRR